MDVQTTWEEFIKKHSPGSDVASTKKKFIAMVYHYMVFYYKQKTPPKHQ